jgi:hypothetical protein
MRPYGKKKTRFPSTPCHYAKCACCKPETKNGRAVARREAKKVIKKEASNG